ncbi:MAG: ACP phosphodiesterase [Prevotella sp.]|jgi:acyl carrier protein phosphodiesterase|nr:ACP phosphodiesterase [Prevotella sp.]
MNFLAHAYLSFGDADILTGNMIADMVKGKQIEVYPETIQLGIRLHREIDSFTDRHEITQQAMALLRPSAGKYAGAFLDVSFDHFLALDKTRNSAKEWNYFATHCYKQIGTNSEILPNEFRTMFMYMQGENWLYSYRYQWMIKRSFKRLQMRANYLDDNAPIFADFKQHYDEIREAYKLFFPQLVSYARDVVQKL